MTRDNGRKLLADPYEWIAQQGNLQTTSDVTVPTDLVDQVIGQDLAIAVARKAASQRRHLLLIGDPGTGKSMIAKAMAQMLPAETLDDVLVSHNAKDPNRPQIASVKAGEGPVVIAEMRKRARRKKVVYQAIEWALILGTIGLGLWFFIDQLDPQPLLLSFLVCLFMFWIFRQRKDPVLFAVPKLLMSHDPKAETHAPYVDGTGAHAGALLGDVRHDPFQSGGLETPPHDRVEVGAIHKAHKGVLFIDEINVLRLESQQALLTAMQDRKYPIVGQSQTSSGAMVRTDAVPCDFVLVAAGNLDAVAPPSANGMTGMHPALRSRIRGYGYEVYVNSTMLDTHENRVHLVRFVAQEVRNDGRIPHFERDAIAEVLLEAQRRSGQRGKLTLRLRELGGLVRTAGDLAAGEGRATVTSEDVRKAKVLSRSLEQQIAESVVNERRGHETWGITEPLVGVAHGAGLLGSGEVGEPAGLVIPITSAVTPPLSRQAGQMLFGGDLNSSAPNQTETVAALLKSLVGDRVANADVHVQALVPQTGVQGDGVGVALAVAALSTLEGVPVRQDHLLVGALTVQGELRPIRGITQKLEAASDAGYRVAIVPEANRSDVLLSPVYREKLEVRYAARLSEVLEAVLVGPGRDRALARARALGRVGTNGHAKKRAEASAR